jgi:hypothetical protein
VRRPGYPRSLELDAVPALDAAVRRALVAALDDAWASAPGASAYDDAWRRAALSEGVAADDPDAGYALSPRSTRGATRA